MRARGICYVLVILILVLALVATTGMAMAGQLTGASTYGVQWDAGEFVVSSSTTYDYELASGLFVTFDSRTDYSRLSQPASRYELSLNYYPTFSILEGWCVSIGGVYQTRSGPEYFAEISKPFEWPPAWLRTIWSWFRRE